MTTHEILGEPVRMPVEIRSAQACTSLFAVPEAPARRMVAEAGLEPVRLRPGRVLCALAFIRYADGDLGPYNEFAVALMCRQPGLRRTVGAYVRWLPVTQRFTCEAGRSIWGFPKEVLDIDVSPAASPRRCVVRADGRNAVAMHASRGVPVPSGTGPVGVNAYTWREGVLRRTPWRMSPSTVRVRPGGARLHLGDHPAADELRELGLPRTALATADIGSLRMSFDDAVRVG